MNLFDLSARITLDTKGFDEGIDKSSNKASGFASKLKGGFKTAAKVGAAAVGAIGTAAVVTGKKLADGIQSTAQYADNVDKMSQKMGLSAEKYQEWDFIMQHSGTTMESLKAGMKTLANAAENGNEAFARLGITQQQIATMSQEELFEATLSGLQNVTNETERTYLAGQLLGRGATELGALLNTSAEDTEAMRKQVHELGGVMSDEAVKAGAAFQDSLQNAQYAFRGLKNNLMADFLPAIVKGMDGVTALVAGDEKGFGKIKQGVDELISDINKKIPKFIEMVSGIVEAIGSAFVENLPEMVDTVVEMTTQFFQNDFPKIIDAGMQLIKALMQGMSDNSEEIFASITSVVTSIIDSFTEHLPEIIKLGLDLIYALSCGIYGYLPEIIDSVIALIDKIVEVITNPENLQMIIDSAINLIFALAEGLTQFLPELTEAAVQIIIGLAEFLTTPENLTRLITVALNLVIEISKGLIRAIPELLGGVGQIVSAIWNGISGIDWHQLGKNVIASVKRGLSEAWEGIKAWFNNAWENLFGGRSVSVSANASAGVNGSHANGLDFVPFDGYIAELHQGERVLTKEENKTYGKGGTVFSGLTINISGANYSNETDLAEAIAEELQKMTERTEAVYA